MTTTQKYEAYQDEIAELIMQIQIGLRQHSDQQRGQPNNWGYVGDLAHIRDELREVQRFVANEED